MICLDLDNKENQQENYLVFKMVFQKGNKIRLGKINSEEHRRNIGLKSKGRKHSDETKRKISDKLKGK